MSYLESGNILAAYSWTMTEYIGFGILWLFFATIVFALVYAKTESYAISGVVFIAMSSLISPVLPPEIQKYFLLLIGTMIAVLVIKLYKGGS
jgi:hypothetical protein